MSTRVAPVRVPDDRPAPIIQAQFDAAVRRNTNTVLAVAGGLAVAAALAMSIIALVVSTGPRAGVTNAIMPGVSGTAMSMTPLATAAGPVAVTVAGSNKLGPDGKLHDSFSQTDFAVRVGQPTLLRIDNRDSGPHSITSAAAGVSITVLPGIHTYTMLATRAGRFEWICVIPCDSAAKGWAMTHPGYMAGFITAT